MIVVAGEALIDLVPQEPGALAPLRPARGGGPYNTAVALARLGSRTAFCSRLSTDTYGQALLDGLHTAGVETPTVQRGPEPTPLALATLDDDGSAAYTFHVEGTADRLFTTPTTLPKDTLAVSFGTCSLVLEPGASAYEELLHHSAAQGLFTALDPNIRPGLIPDPDAYRTRFRTWLPSVTLLKLSREDATWLGGTPQEWLAAGPSAVVITQGADGLTAFTHDGGVHVTPGEKVDVVDTIGAGDTVNAALLHGLSLSDALSVRALEAMTPAEWQTLLRFAAHAAAITCSRAGAEPPYLAELGTL
ncbi:carbohydrate kinase family protein [Streptomyces antibioticus]|uniref:Carbohydrate kinase n=1 Tax=Streptomyces antibioticus TaxID=1890 RepID=A0AAE6Y5T3_STRAT|nr:carbohydrate kinase [Streptomyces antibioticus]OOQ52723.1 sugar kinase [Streptomyces antibioticus]QIT43878.1 carbohydrate kinase [Streptomyces antibioticus]